MDSLHDKRLILICGKGGVGRSTVGSAIASALARDGKRTLLFEASAKDRFQTLFDGPPIAMTPTELAPNLWAVNTNPSAALREYGLMVLRFERVYNLVFENRLTRYFLRAIPGLDDYSVLGKCWYHTTEHHEHGPVWDTVVFDLPASGHALSMLRVPNVIVNAVPDGPLKRDAVKIQGLLRNPHRTALVLVTLAEDMPANEAKDFAKLATDDLGINVTHLVVNQLYPDHFPTGSPGGQTLRALQDAQPTDSDLRDLTHAGQLGDSRRRLNESYLEDLARHIAAPRILLPFLFTSALHADHIRTLSRYFAAGNRPPPLEFPVP